MKALDYRKLYFEDPAATTLNIADVQTSVKVQVKFGDNVIAWAHTVGDFGAEPETLECTPLSASVSMNKTGIQSVGNWTVNLYFNDPDLDNLDAEVKGGEVKTITVTLPNGTTLTNQAKCTAAYPTGFSMNSVIEAVAVFELSNPNGWVRTKKTDAGLG